MACCKEKFDRIEQERCQTSNHGIDQLSLCFRPFILPPQWSPPQQTLASTGSLPAALAAHQPAWTTSHGLACPDVPRRLEAAPLCPGYHTTLAMESLPPATQPCPRPTSRHQTPRQTPGQSSCAVKGLHNQTGFPTVDRPPTALSCGDASSAEYTLLYCQLYAEPRTNLFKDSVDRSFVDLVMKKENIFVLCFISQAKLFSGSYSTSFVLLADTVM